MKVSIKERAKAIKKYRERFGILSPILMDPGALVGNAYGVWSHPTTFFIDREGRIVGRVIGGRDWTSGEMKNYIQSLLDGKK